MGTINAIPNKLCIPNLTGIISDATNSIDNSSAGAEMPLSHGHLNNI